MRGCLDFSRVPEVSGDADQRSRPVVVGMLPGASADERERVVEVLAATGRKVEPVFEVSGGDEQDAVRRDHASVLRALVRERPGVEAIAVSLSPDASASAVEAFGEALTWVSSDAVVVLAGPGGERGEPAAVAASMDVAAELAAQRGASDGLLADFYRRGGAVLSLVPVTGETERYALSQVSAGFTSHVRFVPYLLSAPFLAVDLRSWVAPADVVASAAVMCLRTFGGGSCVAVRPEVADELARAGAQDPRIVTAVPDVWVVVPVRAHGDLPGVESAFAALQDALYGDLAAGRLWAAWLVVVLDAERHPHTIAAEYVPAQARAARSSLSGASTAEVAGGVYGERLVAWEEFRLERPVPAHDPGKATAAAAAPGSELELLWPQLIHAISLRLPAGIRARIPRRAADAVKSLAGGRRR